MVLVRLMIKTTGLYCHSDVLITSLILTEIKYGLYWLSPSLILDFIPSFTWYHLPKPQNQHSRTQYHQCSNENLSQSIIKSRLYKHLSFISPCKAHLEPNKAVALRRIFSLGFTKKFMPCVIVNVSREKSSKSLVAVRYYHHPFISQAAECGTIKNRY